MSPYTYSTEIVPREWAYVNNCLGMDNTPVERYTHENKDVQPVQLVLFQRPKCSTDTDDDILGIMNLPSFGAKVRPVFWVVPLIL